MDWHSWVFLPWAGLSPIYSFFHRIVSFIVHEFTQLECNKKPWLMG
jgi:hypothetical protein